MGPARTFSSAKEDHMTFCGYDPLMGEGMRRFGEGLSAALSDKAVRRGRDLGTQLAHELDEIELLTRHLEMTISWGGDDGTAQGFLGLAYFCKFLMADLDDIPAMQADMPGFIARRADLLTSILQVFEDKFEESSSDSVVLRLREAWEAAKRQRP